jgi:hypothetical protein
MATRNRTRRKLAIPVLTPTAGGVAQDAGLKRNVKRTRGSTVGTSTRQFSSTKLYDTFQKMGWAPIGVDRGQVEHVIDLAIGK